MVCHDSMVDLTRPFALDCASSFLGSHCLVTQWFKHCHAMTTHKNNGCARNWYWVLRTKWYIQPRSWSRAHFQRMNVFQGREFKNLCSSDSCLKKTFVFNACTNHVSAEQQDFTKTQKIAIPLNAWFDCWQAHYSFKLFYFLLLNSRAEFVQQVHSKFTLKKIASILFIHN